MICFSQDYKKVGRGDTEWIKRCTYFENLEEKDGEGQYEAFQYILAATAEKVDWAYGRRQQIPEKVFEGMEIRVGRFS